jgi:hypothetical protein
MNLWFTSGKQSGVGTWQSTGGRPKSPIVASIVYGLDHWGSIFLISRKRKKKKRADID